MHNYLGSNSSASDINLSRIKSWVVVRDGVYYQPEQPDRKALRGQPKHFSTHEIACKVREEQHFDDIDFIEQPVTLPVISNNIPAETKRSKNWVVWRWMLEFNEKIGIYIWKKIPYQPNNPDCKAAASRPDEWAEYQTAFNLYDSDHNKWAGVWFSLAGLYVGLDIDDVVNASEDDKSRAAQDLRSLDTYTEASPSKTGLHALAKGDLLAAFGNKNKEINYEIYKDARFFSFSGHVISKTKTIEDRHAQIASLHSKRFPPKPVYKPTADKTLTLSDCEILEKLRNARNREKFEKLWDGDCSDYRGPSGIPDRSAADFAFCCLVGFYTQKPSQILRLVRASKLNRDKWDRADYAERTIKRALGSQRNTYSRKRN
jgi:putative DNA primase/helicase